ncbi:MAG TPA: hypothetical protein VNG12_15525, partial [Acidimicrobiales bacterium]|nr:hypothetical protein [Acidimicrobiales bacterium]
MCEQLVAVQVLAGVRADVGARAKEISSFIKKLHLKRDKYQDPWSDVTDKLGGRMIVGTLPELARLASVFEDVDRCPVEVLSVEDKSAEADEGA